jgi:ABC-2 type transport system ATP-binding protein
VAEDGLTVVLSSHLIEDLERLCDYLVVLSDAHVQVLGAVDDLLAEHKLLVGPTRPAAELRRLGTVVRERRTDRQVSALVRLAGPVADPGWEVRAISLEELVLAYLEHPSAGALPGPRSLDEGAAP